MHIGKKLERIRTIRGIKQETLAGALGITQAAISKMGKSTKINEEKLAQIAEKLGVTADAIKNFNEDASINNNVFVEQNHNTVINYQINPLEKMAELYNENKKLYEQLLDTERKRIALLEEMLSMK